MEFFKRELDSLYNFVFYLHEMVLTISILENNEFYYLPLITHKNNSINKTSTYDKFNLDFCQNVLFITNKRMTEIYYII